MQTNHIIDATILNDFFSTISTDSGYITPKALQTGSYTTNSTLLTISEETVYHLLNRLKPTATGPDGLPAWYIRMGAPFFLRPLSILFTRTLVESTAPNQWRSATIMPLNKVPAPESPKDFRPISITSILSRIFEPILISRLIYPAITGYQGKELTFSDQFAFRPTGSTNAAIITLIHKITSMLVTEPYVRLICLDFSKAFDSVKHITIFDKLECLPVRNWIVNFFDHRTHKTRYNDKLSAAVSINASVIQGSALGPALFSVFASDLQPITKGNEMLKYADDTYLLIPYSNRDTCTNEIANMYTYT